MISLKHVSKTFDDGQHFAINNVSLDIHEGETLVLLGSSGCGKTTLLKLTNRLLDLNSGTIKVDGKDVERGPLNKEMADALMGLVGEVSGLGKKTTT